MSDSPSKKLGGKTERNGTERNDMEIKIGKKYIKT